MVTDEEILAGRIDALNAGIEKVRKRIHEILEDHYRAMACDTLVLDSKLLKGKVEAYRNCLMLMDKYIT